MQPSLNNRHDAVNNNVQKTFSVNICCHDWNTFQWWPLELKFSWLDVHFFWKYLINEASTNANDEVVPHFTVFFKIWVVCGEVCTLFIYHPLLSWRFCRSPFLMCLYSIQNSISKWSSGDVSQYVYLRCPEYY